MKVEGVWEGLWKDVGFSRRGCSPQGYPCGGSYSFMGLRHMRGCWIMMVFTVRHNYRRQLGCMLYQLQLQKPSSSWVFLSSESGGGVIGIGKTITALMDSMRSCKSSGASLGVVIRLTLQIFWLCSSLQTFTTWLGLLQLKQRLWQGSLFTGWGQSRSIGWGAEDVVGAEGRGKVGEVAAAVRVAAGGEQDKNVLMAALLGCVSQKCLHWLLRRETLCFHSAQVVGMGSRW